jgi:hypothetical protein
MYMYYDVVIMDGCWCMLDMVTWQHFQVPSASDSGE